MIAAFGLIFQAKIDQIRYFKKWTCWKTPFRHCRALSLSGCLKSVLFEVNSSIVNRSSIVRATAICPRRFSLFKSFCRSPERWAKSTISPPNSVKVFTKSVKFVVFSNFTNEYAIYNKMKMKKKKKILIVILTFHYFEVEKIWNFLCLEFLKRCQLPRK